MRDHRERDVRLKAQEDMARLRRNDFLIPALGVVIDGIAIEGAFLFSYWIRFTTSLFTFLPLNEDTPPLDAYIYGSLVVIPVWILIFQSRKTYGARRNVAPADEFFAIVRLVTFGMLVVMSAAFFYRAFSYSRVVFGLLWVTSILFIFGGRMIVLAIERSFYRRGMGMRNAVIVGADAAAIRVFDVLHNHPMLGYRFIGYFADTAAGRGTSLASVPCLGPLGDVPAKLVSERVELALIAVRYEDHPRLYTLIRECEGVNVEFMMVPDVIESIASQVRIKEVEGIPFITIKGLPMTTWGRIMKRTFDIIVAAVLLLILSPLLLVIAAGVKLSSRGKILFRQERIGIDGRKFEMLKFRSMRSDAEAESGPVWASPDDARRTGFGTLLRRASLDELPQLVNVLLGDMSLVGPRPERPFFVSEFQHLVPKYLDRHRVKTGMTGWAQVNGLRGNTSLDERIKYDIYYIENWSFWFDVKILLKTVGALLRGHNAH